MRTLKLDTFGNLNIIDIILGSSNLNKIAFSLRLFMNQLWVCTNRFIKILKLVFFPLLKT